VPAQLAAPAGQPVADGRSPPHSLTAQPVPSILHTRESVPCQQSLRVQPLDEHTPPMHFWPVAALGQSLFAQHSEQMLGMAGQYLPATVGSAHPSGDECLGPAVYGCLRLAGQQQTAQNGKHNNTDTAAPARPCLTAELGSHSAPLPSPLCPGWLPCRLAHTTLTPRNAHRSRSRGSPSTWVTCVAVPHWML